MPSDPEKEYRKKIANHNNNIVQQLDRKLFIPKTITITKINNQSLLMSKKIPEILLCDMTTNEAIFNFTNSSRTKITILNFANAYHVGGGYLRGAGAQEEELCRTIINLYPALIKYENFNKDYLSNQKWLTTVLHTPDLTVFRLDGRQSKNKYDFLDQNLQKKVSVITAAAPDLNNRHKYMLDNLNRHNVKEQLTNMIKPIIKRILLTPIFLNSGCTILILGAFGCGAFAPDKFYTKFQIGFYNELIATIFADTIIELQKYLSYEKIIFAIPKEYSKKKKSTYNYENFKKIFKIKFN